MNNPGPTEQCKTKAYTFMCVCVCVEGEGFLHGTLKMCVEGGGLHTTLYVGGGEGLIRYTLCGGGAQHFMWGMGGAYTWHFMWGKWAYTQHFMWGEERGLYTALYWGRGLIHCTLCGGGGFIHGTLCGGRGGGIILNMEAYIHGLYDILIFQMILSCRILHSHRDITSCFRLRLMTVLVSSLLNNSLISITEGSAGPVSTVQPMSQVAQPDHSALVAMETAKVKAEYEKQLTEMKAMYEAEQMSKQKLQEEMEQLHNNYDKKVHDIEDHYSHDVTAGAMATAQGSQFNGGIAEGASESVISVIPITDQVNNHANLVISLYCIFCCAFFSHKLIGTYWS